jgi:glutamine synthetase
MRAEGGIEIINQACELIGQRIPEHLAVYGNGNEQRLTGKHETCSIHEFRYGVSDRGASIRIPMHVTQQGHGYLEDRRPAANIDPYQVTRVLIETVTGDY